MKDDAIDQLRALLLAPEQEKIEQLDQRVTNADIPADRLSKVLPEAIRLNIQRDAGLARALAPLLADSIMVAIRQDARAFADALFPILGPAIRQSIRAAFQQMIQSLNTTLEHSLSLHGLKWRWEAWRTGKPFAEVALLHSLKYRVEQVFLIHRDTGVLLQHATIDGTDGRDGDLVSAMLTAIQDFVRDSFSLDGDQELDSIQTGEFTIWLEKGPSAVLAVAVRGNKPEHLHERLGRALEDIHREYSNVLKNFDGDTAAFADTLPLLNDCLFAEYTSDEKVSRPSPLLWFFLLAIVAGLAGWAYAGHVEQRRLQDFTDSLDARPGIVVTAVRKSGEGHVIQGLRDPLAIQPEELASRHEIDAGSIEYRFAPYQALDAEIVLKRAERMLKPPSGVELRLEGNTLVLRGSAPVEWLHRADQLSPFIPGVDHLDSSAVRPEVDLSPLDAPDTVAVEFHDGELILKGSAPAAWISSAESTALSIPGVERVSMDALENQDLQRLMDVKRRIEELIIAFAPNETSGERQSALLDQHAGLFAELIELARKTGHEPRIYIIGQTDDTGNGGYNQTLRWMRANFVRNQLISRGVDGGHLVISINENANGTGRNSPNNRQVSFRVELTKRDASNP